MMKIRKATIHDLKAVTEVERVCFPPAEAASESRMRDRLQVFSDYFWLLEDGDKLVGFVCGMLTDQQHLTDEMFADASLHDENGKWLMIFGVATIPEYRCQGCAARVLERVIEDTRKEGRLGLVLTCKDHKVHYYAKFGFVDEGISVSEHGGAIWHEMRLAF